MAEETKNANQEVEKPLTVGRVILVVIVVLYLTLLSVLLVYALVQIWPHETTVSQGNTPPGPQQVTYLFWTLSVSPEIRMIAIVVIAGALGGLVHSLRSAFWYAGHRELLWHWFPMYILLPFVGSILGLVFYLAIRGGFFSPNATIEQTSPYGFAALSALVGMFSEQAVLKLKKVFETLLTEAPQGDNPKPQELNSTNTGGSQPPEQESTNKVDSQPQKPGSTKQ